MKHFYLLLVILFLPFTSQTQILKLRSDSYAMKFANEDGTWKEWTEWMDTKVLSIIDSEKGRITVYLQPKMTFDIAREISTEEDNESELLNMLCVDKDGKECIIQLIKEAEEYFQLYIRYPETVIVYNVNPIE